MIIIEIITYLFNLGICIYIINKLTALVFVKLRKLLSLSSINAIILHSFLTGFLSATGSVIIVKYLLNWLSIYSNILALHIASALIILFYITAFYFVMITKGYYELAAEIANFKAKKSSLSYEYLKYESEKELRSAHAWSVIGLLFGFAIILNFWGYFQINSLSQKILFGYLFLGLASSIEFSGRKMPGSWGYMATFLFGILLWPIVRFKF
jgi:hypothetical protein